MADAVAEDGLVNDTTLSTVIGTLLDRSDFFHMHVAIEGVKQGTLGDCKGAWMLFDMRTPADWRQTDSFASR